MNRNTIKAFTLLASLGGVFVLVGWAIGSQVGALVGLLAGLAIVGASYWFSDRLAVRLARAKPVSAAEAPELGRLVSELTSRSGMLMPRLYLSPAAQPNAFATGRDEAHAALVVTRGLLALLPEDQLRAVLAHELSHVRNHDILIGSVAAALATAITYAANIAVFTSVFGGSEDGEDGVGIFGFLLLALLAPVAATLLQLALSRAREFEADRSGASLLGDGEPLARALETIDVAARKTPMEVSPAQATAYIVNPLTGRQVSFARLFMTHPSTSDRVARLRALHLSSHPVS
jgi:heat shock protein HtpX